MGLKDWSEYHVSLQPLARQLLEQLNRQEYKEANATSNQLMDAILHIKGICLYNRS